MQCPLCGDSNIRQSGLTPSGSQRFVCAGCETTFFDNLNLTHNFPEINLLRLRTSQNLLERLLASNLAQTIGEKIGDRFDQLGANPIEILRNHQTFQQDVFSNPTLKIYQKLLLIIIYGISSFINIIIWVTFSFFVLIGILIQSYINKLVVVALIFIKTLNFSQNLLKIKHIFAEIKLAFFNNINSILSERNTPIESFPNSFYEGINLSFKFIFKNLIETGLSLILFIALSLFSIKLATKITSPTEIVIFPFEQAIIAILVTAIAIGIRMFQRLRTWSIVDRLMAAVLPCLGLLAIAYAGLRILAAPFWDWNSARLAPTFALAKGYQLYYDQFSGPILNTIYGPVTAIAYLPTILLNSLTPAVVSAAAISSLFFFVPILYIHLFEDNQPTNLRKLILGIAPFLGFCFFCFMSPALNYSAFVVHVDAPALGLGSAACICLYKWKFQQFNQKSSKQQTLLFLSALLAILSVWTKQVMLPILLALPLYILLADRRRNFNHYVIYLAFCGIVTSGIFIAIFGYENLVFNLITIPRNHPWIENAVEFGDRLKLFITTLQELISQSSTLVFLLTGYAVYQLTSKYLKDFESSGRESFSLNFIKAWFSENPWLIFLLAGIFMTPTAVLGRIKVGGDVNAFSFTIYFLLAATTLISRIVLCSNFTQSGFSTGKAIAALLTLELIFTHIPTFNTFSNNFNQIQGLATNPRQLEFEYLKKYPESMYFPWNPLAGLMAEGKLYHFSYALYDRDLAKVPVSPEHFQKYLPAKLRTVAASPDDFVMRTYLQYFSQQVPVPDLPGFLVYEKK